jgi:hypothetical protein
MRVGRRREREGRRASHLHVGSMCKRYAQRLYPAQGLNIRFHSSKLVQ